MPGMPHSTWEEGDKVVVKVTASDFAALQTSDFGGWDSPMSDECGKYGTILQRWDNGKVKVKFDQSNATWFINAAALDDAQVLEEQVVSDRAFREQLEVITARCTCNACEQNEAILQKNLLSGLDDFTLSSLVMRRVVRSLVVFSDLNMIFGCIFLIELVEVALTQGLVFWFFLVIVLLGIFAYNVGVLHFMPRQLLQTPHLMKARMEKDPEDFTTSAFLVLDDDGEGKVVSKGLYELLKLEENVKVKESSYTVWAGSTVFPKGVEGSETFSDLNLDDIDDATKFKQGLEAWGLLHIWAEVEETNKWNAAETKHGIPLYRLVWAVRGLSQPDAPQPDARDIWCILNCNTLYAICTGFFQIFFRIMVASHTGGFTIISTLALFLLCLSLALAFGGVALDLPGKLIQAGTDFHVEERCKMDFVDYKTAFKEQAWERHKQRVADNTRWHEFETRMADTSAERERVQIEAKCKDRLSERALTDELDTLEKTIQDIVNANVVTHRRGLARKRALRKGMKFRKCEKQENILEKVQEEMYEVARMKAKLEKDKMERLQNLMLRSSKMTGPTFEQEVNAINLEYIENMQRLTSSR